MLHRERALLPRCARLRIHASKSPAANSPKALTVHSKYAVQTSRRRSCRGRRPGGSGVGGLGFDLNAIFRQKHVDVVGELGVDNLDFNAIADSAHEQMQQISRRRFAAQVGHVAAFAVDLKLTQ